MIYLKGIFCGDGFMADYAKAIKNYICVACGKAPTLGRPSGYRACPRLHGVYGKDFNLLQLANSEQAKTKPVTPQSQCLFRPAPKPEGARKARA